MTWFTKGLRLPITLAVMYFIPQDENDLIYEGIETIRPSRRYPHVCLTKMTWFTKGLRRYAHACLPPLVLVDENDLIYEGIETETDYPS